MLSPVFLAALVAILGPSDVSFVETATGATRTVPLPGAGAAVFMAPDGRTVVPGAGSDVTWVVADGRQMESWTGRLAPLFFDESDRLWTLLPGELALLSYPERAPLRRINVEGLGAVRHASCSNDGRLVVVLPATGETPELWMLIPEEVRPLRRIALPARGRVAAVAADAGVVAVGLEGGGVVLLAPESPGAGVRLPTPGEVTVLLFDEVHRMLVVGFRTGSGGGLVGVRPGKPHKERFRTPLAAAPVALATAGSELVALCGDRVVILGKGGRSVLRELEAPGARGLAVMPGDLRSTLPAWSDGR